jgi:diaminopimelate epimerase
MKFTKMHGIGNDYVYVDGFQEIIANPGEVARKVADRHFGVGGDGLILILPSQKADVRMRMFNADGSEAEMCGNGVRCVAKYAYDHGLARQNPMKVETGRGILTLQLHLDKGRVGRVTVNMGEPILQLADIPVDSNHLIEPRGAEWDFRLSPGHERNSEDYQLQAQLETILTASFVSVGNPHAIIFVENIDSPNLNFLGPMVENHKAFPRRINAHWVQVVGPQEVIMRTWERGSGITLACGTGACAVCVAGVLTGRTERKILAHLPGGALLLEWRESDNSVYMTGPAVEVFSGEWHDDGTEGQSAMVQK